MPSVSGDVVVEVSHAGLAPIEARSGDDADDDRRLLDELRRGSRDALERAYARHKSAVLAVAAGMLGHEGRDGALDVLHDVFVALARSAPGLRDDCNLRAYLLRAAGNTARDRLARRRTRETHADDVARRHASFAGPCIDPALAADARERVAALWDALARLPEEQRTVVAARIFGQESFIDIAAAEGIALNTAHSRYRYGIQKLRRDFGLDPQSGREVTAP
jgi:RNA polymerase sigma factor (sigma-70 family)